MEILFFLYKFNGFSTTSLKTSLKIHIIHALISILIILSLIYIIFCRFIVSNIINKKESYAFINDLNIKSTKVEKDYNLSINSLTKEYAKENGFIDIEMNNFAIRKDSASKFIILYGKKKKILNNTIPQERRRLINKRTNIFFFLYSLFYNIILFAF